MRNRILQRVQGLNRWKYQGYLKPLNKRGLTIMEMMIAMMICSLLLLSVPTIMQMINTAARDSLFSIRAARSQHNAMAEMIKDVKSSEEVIVDPSGQTLTLKRSASENGILYTIKDGSLLVNDKTVLTGIESGSFSTDKSLVYANLNISESEPIQLIMRKPSLKKLVDDGHAPVAPDFDNTAVGLRMDGTTIPTTYTKNIPVEKTYTVNLETVDPMAQILYYEIVSAGGIFDYSTDREYIYGNKITFDLNTFIEPVTFKVKVVSEDGVNMSQYTIMLKPRAGDGDPVPDWMWGSDEAFRTLMRRTFLTSNLSGITFGQVRNITSELPFSEYKITEVPYIVGEFKLVSVMIFEGTFINTLPENFGYKMPHLTVLSLRDCPYLDASEFRKKFQNDAWKAANLPNLILTSW